MRCPSCGGPTKVIDTEKYDSTVVRVRKCLSCGAAETTDEIPRRAVTITGLPSSPPWPASVRLDRGKGSDNGL